MLCFRHIFHKINIYNESIKTVERWEVLKYRGKNRKMAITKTFIFEIIDYYYPPFLLENFWPALAWNLPYKILSAFRSPSIFNSISFPLWNLDLRVYQVISICFRFFHGSDDIRAAILYNGWTLPRYLYLHPLMTFSSRIFLIYCCIFSFWY